LLESKRQKKLRSLMGGRRRVGGDAARFAKRWSFGKPGREEGKRGTGGGSVLPHLRAEPTGHQIPDPCGTVEGVGFLFDHLLWVFANAKNVKKESPYFYKRLGTRGPRRGPPTTKRKKRGGMET